MKSPGLLVIAVSIALASLLICPLPVQSQAGAPHIAQNGLIDLRHGDLYQRSVTLDGNWFFHWKALVFPGDTIHPTGLIRFPALWKGITVNGQALSAQGYGTYQLTVLLPRKRPKLAVQLPDVYASYAFFVNGELLAKNGQPARTAEASRPFWATKTVSLPQHADTLRILLQVANFWHAKGGTYKEILLGDEDQLVMQTQRADAYDLVLTGCLFMGGLFFLGLYLFGRKDRAILYFSLFCIVYSYRMIGTNLYVLHDVFPALSWWITIRLEYLTLSMGVALFVQYTRYLYAEDVNPLLMKGMIYFCLLFSAMVLCTAPIVFTSLLQFFLGAMFLCVGYAFFVNFRAARHRRHGSVYALLSTVVVLLVFLMINLNYFGLLPPLQGLVFAGYISFFFLQSLALSHRFAYSFQLAALQAQQGLRAKSEFLSTMSHEIRTPLNAVIGMTHVLLRHDPRQDQKKDLDVLLFSANNLLSIVNNILDYNKIEEGKIHFEYIPMSFEVIARNILAGLGNAAVEKGIDLQLDIDPRLRSEVLGDPTRTGQVINNLLHNAIKFTHRGWVRLGISVVSQTEDQVTVCVRVDDTGIGIPVEKQQLIFERFTQADSSTSRSYGGTGLGLAISKRILALQGISLMLHSEPGKGSSFYYTQTFALIQAEKPANSAAAPQETRDEKCLQGLSILLVEDNPFNVMVAQTILENGGAQIDVATNGQEALCAFDSHKHRLILMDLQMPVMDGYKATACLRQKGETLPIIALTANTHQEVEGEAYAAGMTDILVKPFEPNNLYQVILQYIHPAV